jgi:hypothetical protein
VALGKLLDSFFTEEWIRFTRGIAKLDPEQQRLAMLTLGQQGLLPGETATINIPGWDEVIKLGPRYQATSEERGEYYAALRENRAPALSVDAKASMDYSAALRERIRTSAQPGYAQAWGEVLTAVDNVQDLASTVATFGRLGLWSVERGFNLYAPGLTAELAAEAGAAAARSAEQAAFGAFERGLLDAVARGEPVAAFLLGDEAALTLARRAAVELAGKAAYQAAFRSALLGLGSRLALRILPIVGWALLAADLLNLLSMLGMFAMPVYAALCKGPADALVAGVPAVVFSGALKRETWTMHTHNPFSRQARAIRRVRAGGRIPSFVNLLEVFQTTEQLFGYGITLGGLVGTMMESAFAVQRASRGEQTSVNFSGAAGSYTDPARATMTPGGRKLGELGAGLHGLLGERVSTMSYADLVKNQQAAQVMTQAPAVLGVQETFDDETHLKTLIAFAAALSTLAPIMRGINWQDMAAELADVELVAPWPPSQATQEWAAAGGHELASSRRWWWPGAGLVVTGAEYVAHHQVAIPEATRAWFIPRRNTVEGAFYGAMVNAVAEAIWLFLEDDDEFLRWEMTTDARLLSSFVEAGRAYNYLDGADKLWAMWQDARQVIEWQGATSLQAPQWDYLAKRHGVALITLLPPGSAWPVEWDNWIAAGAPERVVSAAAPPEPSGGLLGNIPGAPRTAA